MVWISALSWPIGRTSNRSAMSSGSNSTAPRRRFGSPGARVGAIIGGLRANVRDIDNFGEHMMTVSPAGIVDVLTGLAGWFGGPLPGTPTYADVWAVRSTLSHRMRIGAEG